MEEKEVKHVFDIKQNPWRVTEAQLHEDSGDRHTSEQSGPGARNLEQFCFCTRSHLLGVPKSQLLLDLLASTAVGNESTTGKCKEIWKHTGEALTSSITTPPPRANKSQHPSGSISQVFPKLSHFSLPLAVSSSTLWAYHPWSSTALQSGHYFAFFTSLI